MASPQLLSPSSQAGLGDLLVELTQLIASYLAADAQETYVEVHEASSSNEAQTQSISGSSLDSAGSINTEAEGKNPRTQGQDTICDLKNLTITCKGFYEILKPVLYAQGKHNDWHALRWGSFHGVLQTMADAVAAGAPIDHGADVNQQFGYVSCFSSNTHLSSLPWQHRNPLGLAVFTQTVGPLAVKFLLDNGASFEMGAGSLLMPILAHMSLCRIPDLCWKAPVSIPLYGCETKASLLLSTHEPHKDCSCIPSYDSLNQHGEIDPGVRYYAWDDSHLPYGGPEISKVFRFLREHGLPIVRSDLDEIYSNAIPPLIKATRSSNPEAARLLIEEGENPNVRCPLELSGHFPLGFRIGFRQGLGGRTALAYACAEVRKNQPQVVRQLLEGGADPMGRTASGLTPMQILSRSLPERGTVQVLLDSKARPSTMGL
ncbi:hypothetical protein CMUS01_01438 [Colletotrichum musicola]|uniref:Ankyrin repeat protein n=1 Tax=Colletotrichum musicola TaxID=2175873 RepID=A0A8H6NWW7_9PEZI|nr:hypothetical protein CMUS01_01438 [Colletotrichum musicola]